MSTCDDVSTITLASNCDLCVRTTYDDGSERLLLVSTAVMCLASPVWAAMLKPTSSFMESEAKEVNLSDDDAESILITLRIAHLKHLQIPATLNFEQLYEMAVVCDKYDMVTLVSPWLDGWATERMKEAANKRGYERWLFIAYTFGFAELFEKAAKSLGPSSKTDGDGRCLNADAKYLEGSYPPDIIGKASFTLLTSPDLFSKDCTCC